MNARWKRGPEPATSPPVTANRSSAPCGSPRRCTTPMRRRTSSAKNSYKDDPDLPYEQVGKWDGYTRGHMLGSAERLVSREANSQVMYFSNIGPQLGQNDYFNGGGGQWNTAEDWVDEQWRGLADTCYQVVGCYWADNRQEGLRYDDPDPLFHRAAQSQEERRKEMGGELHARRAAMHRPVYRAQVLLEERRDETRSIRLERHLHARLRSRSEDRTQILHERPNAPKDTYDTRDWNF